MVLNTSKLLVFLATFLFIGNSGPLRQQYDSKISKDLVKLFDAKKTDNLQLDQIATAEKSIEAYSITKQDRLVGYCVIKEVKACSLNGCVAQDVINDNLASEYYDLAVFTDDSKKILSIRVLDYFSDYGYEITSKRYLAQYHQKNLCDFSLEHPQVDGISGATISYNALIASLGDFCTVLQVASEK